MKHPIQSVALLLTGIFLASATLAEEKVLNLYSWSEYFPKPVLDGFTQKTGIKVNLALYSTNEELMDKLASGVSSYDVVVPSDYAVGILTAENRLKAIDRSKVPNFGNLDPKQMGLKFDKENKFSVPYFWGTTGLGINKEVIKDPVDSWAVVFDAKNSGKISMLKDARENFAVALKMMGKSINETDKAALKQAAEMLSKQTKLVKSYDSDSFDDKLRTGEAAIVQGFSGQLAKVVKENPAKFYYVVPKEGATRWVDNLAIPAGAPHPDAAHEFINYVLDPQVGAEIAKTVGYASANAAAQKLLPDEMLKDQNIYAPDDVLKRCELMDDIGKAAVTIDKLWTKLKAN